jgi:hypothetical protein
MAANVNPVAVGAVGVGLLFIWSGIGGRSVLSTLQSIVQGKQPDPSTVPADAITTPSGSSSSTTTGQSGSAVADTGSAKSILQKTAAGFGWTGAEWSALVSLENDEDGFNPTQKNGSSGALGLAQALGHGNSNTAGTLGNEYGGNGLTDAQAKLANSGDAAMQSLWMCNYIKDRYGSPTAALAHENSYHWY